MKLENITITLLDIVFNNEFLQYGFGIFAINERFLFFIGKDYNKWIIDFLFIKITPNE